MTKILLLLLIPSFAFCQQKGDNCIIVKGVSFKEALNTALDHGFSISMKDDSLQIFSTVPRTDKRNDTHVYYVRIKDSAAYITGEFDVNMNMDFGGVTSKFASFRIENKGTKISSYQTNFRYMQNFARDFNKEISYTKL
jgi:hypothetical protein